MCICVRCLHVNENDKGITACNEKNVDISAVCIQNVVKKATSQNGDKKLSLHIIDFEETCIIIIITFIMRSLRNMMITTTLPRPCRR